MRILIVGGGKPVHFLCSRFLAKGHEVTVVNRDADECLRMSRRLRVTVIHGDASDPRILEDAGCRSVDAVLAVTGLDHENLAVCQIARRSNGVEHTLALVNDPENEQVFRKLGVGAISTTRIVAGMIEQRAALDQITDLLPVGEGEVNITQVEIQPDAPAAGRKLKDLALPPDSLVAAVLREGRAVIPRGDTELRVADRVVLITLPANHGAVLETITGPTG